MLKDRTSKIFEGWEDQDSPFAKMRLAKEPVIEKILDLIENAGPENEEKVYNLIYKFTGKGPTNNEDPYIGIEQILHDMRLQDLQQLDAYILKNLKNVASKNAQPTKDEGTGPADGNSGESQSMAGSMTYENKEQPMKKKITEATVQREPAKEEITVNEKGKIAYLEPTRQGNGSCPFWAHVKSNVAKSDKTAQGIRIPKTFINDIAKRFKVPLHEAYAIPLCVSGNKVCSFFGGAIGDNISCNFGETKQPQPKEEGVGQPSTPDKNPPIQQSDKREAIVMQDGGSMVPPTSTTPTAVTGVRG